jgi:peptide/nickel transport system permease protein
MRASASPPRSWSDQLSWIRARLSDRSLALAKGFYATLSQLLRNPTSALGLSLLSLFALVALLAPILAPPEPGQDPYQMPRREIVRPFAPPAGAEAYEATPSPPSANHILGTGQDQYDIFYGLVWGTRTAFRLGIIVVFSSLFIGIILGAISGYYGGWIDELLQRVVEVFLAFPFLVSAVVLTAILGKGLNNIIIAFIVFGWPFYARLIRGEVLHVKENNYVEAAQALGAPGRHIIVRHLLPNAIYPVLVLASLDIGAYVLSFAALSFLGLGTPGSADWGYMINASQNWIIQVHGNTLAYWYTFVVPSIIITLFVLGWNLLGDAVRDISDPRLRGGR